MGEKQPSFDRVIGGNEDQKNELIKESEQESLKSGEDIFGEYLVKPDEFEKIAIAEAVDYANKIASQYGAKRETDPKRVFILKPEGVAFITKGRLRNGFCDSLNQSIAIDRRSSNATLAMTVAHESFHMSSYQSGQIFKDGAHGLYRSGIEMIGRQEEKYFSLAMEAIIATLSRRFFDEVISKDPLYSKEIEQTETIKKWLEDFAEKRIKDENSKQTALILIKNILILPNAESLCNQFFESKKNDAYKFGYFMGVFEKELKSGSIFHERIEEREKFEKTLNEIIKESKGQISNREEIFNEFARAHFSGNYLPLARIIEGALGKGSFRRIAEKI